MANLTQKILALIFFLTLVFPGQNVFAARSADLQTGEKQIINREIPQIFVQIAPPKSQIEIMQPNVGPKPAKTGACLIGAGQAGDAVQQTAAINFNQPANCFDLRIFFTSFSHKNLAVADLPKTDVKIIVNVPKAEIQSPALIPAPAASGLPLLPALVFTAAISLLAFERRLFVKVSARVQNIRTPLTMFELGVLRC